MLDQRILFIDAEAMVIDKPAGLPVDTPRRGGDSVVARLGELKQGFQRPPTGIVGKAREVGAAVKVRPFDISFNRIGTWRSGEPPWPLVLWGDEGVIGVQTLYGALHRAMVGPGMAPRREPPLEPHLTLLRDQAVMPEAFIDPIAWTVREFVLLQSVYGEGRLDVLARFPLSG